MAMRRMRLWTSTKASTWRRAPSNAAATCTYRDHPNCRFDGYDSVKWKRYDLALSLDVLYHIVDHREYVSYLRRLFSCSDYVLLYANREARPSEVAHIVNRDNFAEIAKLDLPTELIEEKHHPRKSTGFALFWNSSAKN